MLILFWDFESFLKSVIDLVEDDVRLVLDEYISSFITYELEPGFYTFKDICEALFNILHPEYRVYNNSVGIEYDDKTMKTILVVGPGIIVIRFNEKSFFINILCFTSRWQYKHYNKYISQKILHSSSTNKLPLKCDVIEGSVVNGSINQFYTFCIR